MKILLIHNHYLQAGGEDSVFEAERTLLSRMGHEVIEYVRHNEEIDELGVLRTAVGTVWSRDSQHALRELIRTTRPHVAHFHNTFLLVSPAAYYVCQEEALPVVQTLHNYRLLCPAGTFFRDGQVCEDCMGRTPPWPGVLHGCWRGSRGGTALVATMLTVHRWLNTWGRQVDLYIALTEFARRKFIEGGLPAEKIVVKPNFVESGEVPPSSHKWGDKERGYALYVGRLSTEKGVRTLLRAWRGLQGIPLRIAGDGPLMAEVHAFIDRETLGHVEVLGQRPRKEVLHLIQQARFLVFPSQWYETFGMTIAESFACGTPVIASLLGTMADIVDDGQTGLHFDVGNPEDLREKVDWAWTHPGEMSEMGRRARREYERKYTADRNYGMLMDIYRGAIARAQEMSG